MYSSKASKNYATLTIKSIYIPCVNVNFEFYINEVVLYFRVVNLYAVRNDLFVWLIEFI